MQFRRAFIAFGANLGDAIRSHSDAVCAIEALPATQVVAQSALYQSAPIGVEGHPDYINAVLEVRTKLSPQGLLAALLDIERRHGRNRTLEVSPRAMDLDLLLYEDMRIVSESLTLPHPRMHLRAFVLLPLAELDPTLGIPGHGKLTQLLGQVADQHILRLETPDKTHTMESAIP